MSGSACIATFRRGAGWISRGFIALVLLAAAVTPAASQARDDASIAAGSKALQAVHDDSKPQPDRERARLITRAFHENLAQAYTPARLASASDDELDLLFQAANMVVFYGHDAIHLALMEQVKDAVEARNRMTDRHRRDMYRAWVLTRRFDDARAMAQAHPDLGLEDLPSPPQSIDGPVRGVRVWRPATDGASLAAATVDIDVPRRIVVLMHPRCGFSQRAIRDIEADPVLSGALRHDTVWLVPPSGQLNLADIQQWNREHPDASLAYAVQAGDWPSFDSWSTPVFYFLRHGRVVAQVTGWPDEGRARELHHALAEMARDTDE